MATNEDTHSSTIRDVKQLGKKVEKLEAAKDNQN